MQPHTKIFLQKTKKEPDKTPTDSRSPTHEASGFCAVRSIDTFCRTLDDTCQIQSRWQTLVIRPAPLLFAVRRVERITQFNNLCFIFTCASPGKPLPAETGCRALRQTSGLSQRVANHRPGRQEDQDTRHFSNINSTHIRTVSTR